MASKVISLLVFNESMQNVGYGASKRIIFGSDVFNLSTDNKMINFIFTLPSVIVPQMQHGLWADWFLSGSGTGV